MKSVTILNQGLGQIKGINNESDAHDITAETYVKLMKHVLDGVGKERKMEVCDRLAATLIEESSRSFSDCSSS